MRRLFKCGKVMWNNDLNKKHTQSLKEIISKFGWPTIPMVGRKASKNAWLLVQHAEHAKSFQKKCLHLMLRALKENPKAIDKKDVAFLTDRVLLAYGKKQRFGTQVKKQKNKITSLPIANKRMVDVYRAEYDLLPLADYLALFENDKR